MICSVAGCDHEGAVRMRVIAPKEGRWRDYCGCCAEMALLMFAIVGKRVEIDQPQKNLITDDEMEQAHNVLKQEDVRVSDLIG